MPRRCLGLAAAAWFAQSLPAFLQAYDYVGLMAMPQLDKRDPTDQWFQQLVDAVADENGGLDRTVFELASKDRRNGQPIPAKVLGERMRFCRSRVRAMSAITPMTSCAGSRRSR
jgi:biofilm PGA synthesis lipoprotein PgaB